MIIPLILCTSSVDVSIRAVQRVALQLPPRRAPQDAFKKGTISRAEGGQLQAPVGPRSGVISRI